MGSYGPLLTFLRCVASWVSIGEYPWRLYQVSSAPKILHIDSLFLNFAFFLVKYLLELLGRWNISHSYILWSNQATSLWICHHHQIHIQMTNFTNHDNVFDDWFIRVLHLLHSYHTNKELVCKAAFFLPHGATSFSEKLWNCDHPLFDVHFLCSASFSPSDTCDDGFAISFQMTWPKSIS